MIRAALVEDEPPARRKVRHLLGRHSDFSIVGEADSGAKAVQMLQESRPDLVFLDIQLPDCTGFDVLESLPEHTYSHLVFVTAFDDFAVKAFEVHAIDYLLKPVEPSRFDSCLDRIRGIRQAPETHQLASRLDALVQSLRSEPTYARRLLIQEDDRSFFLEVNRIDWLEAARNYVCVHSAGRTFILRSSLEAVRAKLDPARFLKINRSEIINLERINEVRSWFHGDQKVILKDGTELTWSRRYRAGSLEALETI